MNEKLRKQFEKDMGYSIRKVVVERHNAWIYLDNENRQTQKNWYLHMYRHWLERKILNK